ncbi:phosphoribosyltransferase-like protein [Qipengyuania sp. CAU 1752]
MSLSKTQYAQDWLLNFQNGDRAAATLLIDRLMLVSASEFVSGITNQLNQIERKKPGKEPSLALYAEREIDKAGYDVLPFFPNSGEGRASGPGIPPVTVDPEEQDVGSEGPVATLISKYSKDSAHQALSHPGPDALRSNKIRTIVIVTDFIGSGRRISEMLDAFALVASIQSWKSYGLLSFEVVCYSGTERGLFVVQNHSLRPTVRSQIACPVVDEAFSGSELGSVKLLCQNYRKKRPRYPFGFNDTGSLIAFSHGIPNNAPPILHSEAGGWTPLFPSRSTSAAGIDSVADSSSALARNSEQVLGIREARRVLADPEGEIWAHTMLVMHAVRHAVRTPKGLSARTRLPNGRIEEVLEITKRAGWMTPRNTLTRLGWREIRRPHFFEHKEEIAISGGGMYFPTQLGAP